MKSRASKTIRAWCGAGALLFLANGWSLAAPQPEKTIVRKQILPDGSSAPASRIIIRKTIEFPDWLIARQSAQPLSDASTAPAQPPSAEPSSKPQKPAEPESETPAKAKTPQPDTEKQPSATPAPSPGKKPVAESAAAPEPSPETEPTPTEAAKTEQAEAAPETEPAPASLAQTEADSDQPRVESGLSPLPDMQSLSQGLARYNPEERVDPFSPLFKEYPGEEPEKKKEEKSEKPQRPLTPLEKVDLSQLKLVGIIRAPSGDRALVEEASGKGYIIQEGTPIGIHSGQVAEIQPDRVIVEEKHTKTVGDPISGYHEEMTIRKRELKLPSPEERYGT